MKPDSTNDVSPIADSMPPIPTFEPAPVPKPVVTDTMPPIPVTAPNQPTIPVSSTRMPIMSQRPQPAPTPQPTAAVVPQNLNRSNPATNATPVAPVTPATPSISSAPTTPPAPIAPAAPNNLAAPSVSPTPTTPAAPTTLSAPAVHTAPEGPSIPVNLNASNPSAPFQSPRLANQPVPAAQPNLANQPTPAIQPNQAAQPNIVAQPRPFAQPTPADRPSPLNEPTNPFAEAAAKNNAIRNVSFSAPNATIPKQNSFFQDKKRLIIIGCGAAFVLIMAIILIAMSMGGSKSPAPAQNQGSSNSSNQTTSKAGNYVCSRDYLDSEIHSYGDSVKEVKEDVSLAFSKNGFKDIESKTTITYIDSTVVKAGYASQKEQHATNYQALGFTADPLTSTYKLAGSSLVVTRSAAAADLDSKSLKLFGISSEKAPSKLTVDDVLDLFEANKFSCQEKKTESSTPTTE